METLGPYIAGFGVGLTAAVVVISITGGTLSGKQSKYAECLALGAPQQNCLEKFLLPKVRQ